jgi:HEAT repeat protein
MWCQPDGVRAEEQVRGVGPATTREEPNTPLQLYRAALVNHGSNEQMQVDAANLLLLSKDPAARKILLDTLKQSENNAARAAVCKALIKTVRDQKSVEKSGDFIAPLLGILSTEQDFGVVKLAAEASLLFEYEQIAKHLENLAADASMPVRSRSNAVYALKLHPDKRAAIALLRLVDDPNSRLAAESEKALRLLGIPIGRDAETRKQIAVMLKGEDPEAFLRNRLIRQGGLMRKLEAERNSLRRQYLDALERVYLGMKDSDKGVFLGEHLGSSQAVVRSWALDKVYELRIGAAPLPAELGPVVISLLGDPEQEVRLKTAKVLSVMAELNPAERLLERLRIEENDEVKTEVLGALGTACSYASVIGTPAGISHETRTETLEWALKFLAERDPGKSQKGAEVIKKLLERNGMASTAVGRYLGLLGQRYRQEKDADDGQLRGELLGRMAGLCAQGSACKFEATNLFGPIFEEALGDGTDLVREAAVDGLIHIDSSSVLKKHAIVLAGDPSIRVRERVINLAGEIGGEADLAWLWEKIGSMPQNDPAWESMLKIFRRSEAALLAKWLGIMGIDCENPQEKLNNNQKTAVLEIAEQKIIEAETLRAIRKRLAALHKINGRFDQAADYYNRLYDDAATGPEERKEILASLLDVHLRWPNISQAAQLINKFLDGEDLDPNSGIVSVIDGYLNVPPVGTDPNSVLRELLDMVKTERIEKRPGWTEQTKRWFERLGKTEAPERPKSNG